MAERKHTITDKLRLFHKYFLKRTPHDGPVTEKDLGIHYLDFDIDRWYEQVTAAGSDLARYKVGTITDFDDEYPVYRFRKQAATDSAKKLLVLSPFHGNEQAAALAVPDILEDLHNPRYDSLDVSVLTPINPVGLVHHSRYNGQGFDINRDFVQFKSKEAQMVRKVLDLCKPDFVVSLHEGPQDGTFLCANQFVRPRIYSAALRDLSDHGIELAQKDFVGRKLSPPGLEKVDGVITFFGEFSKYVLGLQTSGHFLRERRIPLITVETPWGNTDSNQRTRAHVLVMRSVAETLK